MIPGWLQTIIQPIVNLLSVLKSPNSIQNDVADGIAILSTVEGIDPGLALAAGTLKALENINTEYTDLVNNQAALVGTVGATFDGMADKVMVFAIRESSPLAKQLFGV
jgi:hypothetical protein